jgi:hypothetical protein
MLETYKVGVTLDMTSNVAAVMDKMMDQVEAFNKVVKETSRALTGLRSDFRALGDASGSIGKLSAAMDRLSSARGGVGEVVGNIDRMGDAMRDVTAVAERLGAVLRENWKYADAMAHSGSMVPGGPGGGGGRRRGGGGGSGGLGGHDLMLTGLGASMVAAPVVSGVEGALSRAFEVGHLRTQILADQRVSPEQADKAVDTAYAAANAAPGTRVTENLKALIDLKNVTGSLDEAETALPKFAQLSALLQVMDRRSGGSGDPAYAAAKAMEIMGQMIEETTDPSTGKVTREINPAMLNQHLDMMSRVAVATNMRVSPSDYLGFAKQARVAGMMLSDEFIYEKLPAWMQTTGGPRVGTALMSMAQVFQGGKLTNKSYDAMAAIGLAGAATTSMERDPKTGRMHKVRHESGIYDLDLMRKDPLEYMQAAQKRMDAAGIHGTDNQLVALLKASQRSTIAGALAELLKDMPAILKEQQNILNTKPDAFSHFAGQDPEAKLQQLQAAFDKLMTTLGSSAMGDAVKLMDAVTAGLNRLADWARENPGEARALTDLAAAASAIGIALGSLSTAMFLFGPALRLLGITGGGAAAAGEAAAGGATEAEAATLAAAAGGSALAGVLAGVILPAAIAGVVGSRYETPETEAQQAELARQRRALAGGPNGSTYDGYGPDGQPLSDAGMQPARAPGSAQMNLPPVSLRGTPENPVHVVMTPGSSGATETPGATPSNPTYVVVQNAAAIGAAARDGTVSRLTDQATAPKSGPTIPQVRVTAPMPGMPGGGYGP